MSQPQVQACPRWVVRDTDRHGNVRHYFRRPGQKKVRLPGEPGSDRFTQAYHAALRGEAIMQDGPATIRRPKRSRVLKVGGYVYFLRLGETVKIGYSTDPLSRLTGLRTAMSGPVTGMVFVQGTQQEERRLHSRFRKSRLDGEWFRLTSELQQLIARAAAYGRLDEAIAAGEGPTGNTG